MLYRDQVASDSLRDKFQSKKKTKSLAAQQISDPDEQNHGSSIMQDDDAERLRHAKKYDYFIILPDDPFKATWDVINMLLILFVCVTTPARIAFLEDDDFAWTLTSACVDTFFLVDLVLNFFSAYHDKQLNLIDDRKKIAKRYLKGWFLVDIFSILPISLITRSGDYNSLARIARFPKLYRLVKIMRLVRILKVVKEQNKFVKNLNDGRSDNAGSERLFFFILVFVIVCHIVACLWIFSARLEDFNPDTWVVRYGF